jgi:hypothetical protein
MRNVTIAGCIVLAVVTTAPAALAQGIPDLGPSYAYLAYGGPEAATVLVVPDGGGRRFDEAVLSDGTVVDATLTLVVLDGNEDPVFGYPWEDLWLESADGGMVACNGGTTADANTDPGGETQWVLPLLAGGWSQALTQVYVNGSALTTGPGLNLHVNSPDLNGDLKVDLADLSQFVLDYFGAFAFRSDLFRDGLLNLADVAVFARALGAECP